MLGFFGLATNLFEVSLDTTMLQARLKVGQPWISHEGVRSIHNLCRGSGLAHFHLLRWVFFVTSAGYTEIFVLLFLTWLLMLLGQVDNEDVRLPDRWSQG